MFLKNCWYVAAWSKDIRRELLGRVLLNEYVVLYRKEDGTPVALENRCPHRNLPLSEGRLIGDEIECGYHGMVFNCDGVCTACTIGEDTNFSDDVIDATVTDDFDLRLRVVQPDFNFTRLDNQKRVGDVALPD